jgi:hypothetical protein
VEKRVDEPRPEESPVGDDSEERTTRDEQEIDEVSEESFPASDPPSF